METNCVLFVLLTVSCQCYGGLLDGFLSGAQETHNKVHDVANTFLGGLSHGINLNFQGHYGLNNQQRPPPLNNQNHGGGQSGKPGETVVIVVEQEPNREQHRPGHNRPHHHNGYNNNNYRPGYGNNPNYNNHGQGNPYENHHHHGYGNGNWNGNNGNEQPNNGNYQPNNGNYQPNNGNPNQNNYGQPNRPPYENPHQSGPHNQYTTEYVTKEPEKNTPNYGTIYNPSTENNEQPQKPSNGGYDQEKTTKKPDEDKPHHVPLNPNEYNYGGDKIDVTAPKRETNDKPKPAEKDDDDFPIDIRFQDD